MATSLFLVRNGATDFNRDGRFAGRREVGLSSDGRGQAKAVAGWLAGVDIAEVLASPLPRAVETAEQIAQAHGLEVARDSRLTDFDAGALEGKPFGEIETTPEYRRFANDPVASPVPGGERMTEVRDRVVSSITQALADNEYGANLVVVTHAGPVRIALVHYLGMELGHYHRLRVSPGSISILRFDSESAPPRVLALNCLGMVDPAHLLRGT